jgi:hypothetical protein
VASPPEPVPAGEAKDSPDPAGRGLAPSVAGRLAVLVVAAFASALGAWLGAWWVPFVVGLAAGALGRAGVVRQAGALGRARARAIRPRSTGRTPRPRGGVPSAVAGAILGWAIPIWALALDGQPAGATARVIASLAGLPPYAAVTVAVVLLLAALQVLAGAWLARAVLPARAVTREQELGESPDVNLT